MAQFFRYVLAPGLRVLATPQDSDELQRAGEIHVLALMLAD